MENPTIWRGPLLNTSRRNEEQVTLWDKGEGKQNGIQEKKIEAGGCRRERETWTKSKMGHNITQCLAMGGKIWEKTMNTRLAD